MKKLKTLIFTILVVLSFYSFYNTILDIYQKSRRVTDLKNEITALENENEELRKEFSYKSSREFIEKEAREKLFMGKPGETILVIPENFFESLKKVKGAAVGNTNYQNIPNWRKWWETITK